MTTKIRSRHARAVQFCCRSSLIEKLAHFNRERMPERIVHAKGAGAGGYFEVTKDVTKYTKANSLSQGVLRTEGFVRFSKVGGEKGSADAERDPRGFAVKFYTKEGNYDLVGNNTPVFFIRDPLKFPDFIHTQNRNPESYFAEVEQAAFSPGNFVPSVAASPDKMLQGCLFAYYDAHRYRLGPNFHLLPVNRPKASEMKNYQRAGYMCFDSNEGGNPNYYSNSFGGPEPDVQVSEPAFKTSGNVARQPYTHPNDNFVQPGDLYRKVMTNQDRDHFIDNIVAHLRNANKETQIRQAKLSSRQTPIMVAASPKGWD
jgi:catalase